MVESGHMKIHQGYHLVLYSTSNYGPMRYSYAFCFISYSLGLTFKDRDGQVQDNMPRVSDERWKQAGN